LASGAIGIVALYALVKGGKCLFGRK
jgi:hypothetical protein